jgi:hypothetical protein
MLQLLERTTLAVVNSENTLIATHVTSEVIFIKL